MIVGLIAWSIVLCILLYFAISDDAMEKLGFCNGDARAFVMLYVFGSMLLYFLP